MPTDPDLRRRGGPSPALRARILAAAARPPWWWGMALAAGVLLLLSALIGPEPVAERRAERHGPFPHDIHRFLEP